MPKEKRQKFYVVFRGLRPGVYKTWEECKKSVSGYPGSSFASFSSETEAHFAFSTAKSLAEWKGKSKDIAIAKWSQCPPMRAGKTFLVVDAACSGYPGPVEFRGVLMPNNEEAFKFGPYASGSNNIGEFLALVTGLKWMRENSLKFPIYSDRANAIKWVTGDGVCNTNMDEKEIGPIIKREIKSAEKWLRGPWAPDYKDLIAKWDTREWGEIPADFNRK